MLHRVAVDLLNAHPAGRPLPTYIAWYLEYDEALFGPKKFCKIFQIPRHIESLDACIKY